MKWIERLEVRGLRNLTDVEIESGAELVVLLGGNGAGKTTVLEGIYLLGRGVSFRGRRHGPLVARGGSAAVVKGTVKGPDGVEELRWDSGDRGEGLPSRLPVRLISSATSTLIDGDPALRRRFLDWTLFHVEQQSVRLWSDFRRVAAQRNGWLRQGATGAAVWDRDYAQLLTRIEQMRRTLVTDVAGQFTAIQREHHLLPPITLAWEGSAADPDSVMDQLAAYRGADLLRGHTWLSPARSQLRFRVDQDPWLGSRGECKIAGILLQLAAERVRRSRSPMRPVWLVDDLGAELSPDVAQQMLGAICAEAAQVWLTTLPGGHERLAQPYDGRWFHVEQGRVRPF